MSRVSKRIKFGLEQLEVTAEVDPVHQSVMYLYGKRHFLPVILIEDPPENHPWYRHSRVAACGMFKARE
jgi:hypothetical protein